MHARKIASAAAAVALLGALGGGATGAVAATKAPTTAKIIPRPAMAQWRIGKRRIAAGNGRLASSGRTG